MKPPYEQGVLNWLKNEEEAGTDRIFEGIPEGIPSFSAKFQQPA